MEIQTISPGTFAVSCVVTTIGIVFTVGFLTFNVFHRKKRFIKMSSPKLNIMISSGGLSLNIACLMYGMDFFLAERYPEATVTCQIRLWLLTLGFTLVFGPMFAKAWRVYQIFRNAGIKRVVIRDTKLFVMSSLFLLVDIAILTLWQSIDIMKSQKIRYMVLVDKHNNGSSVLDYINIQECSSSGTSVWLSVLFLWKTGLLGFGLYLAWKTRNVILPAMRDSASMIISILTTLLLTAPTIMLTSLLRHSPNAIYITEMILITVCITVVQISIFLPKVHFWWKSPIDNPIRLSQSTYDIHSNVKSENPEEEMFQIVTENMSLKRTLTEKSSHIKQLQEHLRLVRKKLSKLSSDSDGKLDSGLDVDMSTSSSHDDVTRDFQHHFSATTANEPNSSEELLETPKRETRKYRSSSDTESVRSYRKRKKKHSKTMTSTPNLYDMCDRENSENKDDIKSPKEHSKSYSCEKELNMTNSLSRNANLHHFTRGTVMYESIRSRQDIAGSVAKSYDLDDDEDTFSYVSSYLQPTFPTKNLEYTLRNSMLCISAENISAIDNDKLYPFPGDTSQSNKTCDSREISASRETLDGSKKAKNKKNISKKKHHLNTEQCIVKSDTPKEIKTNDILAQERLPDAVILNEPSSPNSCYV